MKAALKEISKHNTVETVQSRAKFFDNGTTMVFRDTGYTFCTGTLNAFNDQTSRLCTMVLRGLLAVVLY